MGEWWCVFAVRELLEGLWRLLAAADLEDRVVFAIAMLGCVVVVSVSTKALPLFAASSV